MRDTPIHINGPFRLEGSRDRGWYIRGRDGVIVATMEAELLDGGISAKYPDGVFRSRQAREEEARFVLEAMNNEWERRKRGE